jgi:hypothetical protein
MTLGEDGKTVRGDGKGRKVKNGLLGESEQARSHYARTFGQDLMRGEHVVGAEGAGVKGNLTYATGAPRTDETSRKNLAGGRRGFNSRPPHGASVTQNPDGTLAYRPTNNGDGNQSGTSVFDPVLCEIAYRWFCPPGGAILDPFAGGSVRGIVAAKLGRAYTGIDLSAPQIAANEVQAADICSIPTPFLAATATVASVADYTPELTPIERIGALWAKRDDLFAIAGVRGGKVRSCWNLAQGATGLTTAGSKSSPQVNIVAHIAARLGIPCRVHTPTGALSAEVEAAERAGAEVVQHKAGYNNVIIARAREDAAERGWTNIPFGMECDETITQTRAQVANLPDGITRIVVPVGSGMSLAGILHGLRDIGRAIPVLGVMVGADPVKRLDAYAPTDWRDMVTLVPSGSDYAAEASETMLGDIALDAHYEAKCLPFLADGDLLWIVGIRQTQAITALSGEALPRWIVGDSGDVAMLAPAEYDFLFSCPPYADLERYSDDPRDLSTMPYADFLAIYRGIVAASVGMLRDDRFACFVVGDIRDPKGMYRNFVSDTIAAFHDAGMRLYNEAILVTAVGSLPIRVGRQFEAGRKLGKTHQNVLVFIKGDAKRATEACGALDVYIPDVDELAGDGFADGSGD